MCQIYCYTYLCEAYGDNAGIVVSHNWEWALGTAPTILDWEETVTETRWNRAGGNKKWEKVTVKIEGK